MRKAFIVDTYDDVRPIATEESIWNPIQSLRLSGSSRSRATFCSGLSPSRRHSRNGSRPTVELDPRLGGRLRHTKVRDDDPARTWVVDGIYTEVFYPDVLVSQQRITGIEGIDPSRPVELRVEFSRQGQGKTLLRVVQGPYESQAAVDYAKVWESILDRLQAYIDGAGAAS